MNFCLHQEKHEKKNEYRMDIESEYALYRKIIQGRAIYRYTMEVCFSWNEVR